VDRHGKHTRWNLLAARAQNGAVRRRSISLSLALFALFVGWALVSPVGSSPDDDYHLASIWCSGGVVEAYCEESPVNEGDLLVPEEVAAAHACYAFRADRNASCADGLTANLIPVSHVNQKRNLYPQVFYATMGLFVGPDVERSVVVMRIVNSLVAALGLLAALVTVPLGIARSLVTATLIVYVPLGFFLVPSTNPTSWALTGIATFWAFALGLLTSTSWRARRTWIAAVGSVVGAVLAMGSRLDAAVYLSIVLIVVSITVGRARLRRSLPAVGLLGFLALAGLITYWSIQPTVTQGRGPTSLANPGPFVFVENLLSVPGYLFASYAGPLGWLDTLIPTFIPVAGLMIVGAALYRQVSLGKSRVLAATGVSLGAYVAVPAVFLQLSGLRVGELIQARYLLPLLVVLVGTAGLNPRIRRSFPWPSPAAIAVTGLLMSASLAALWFNARRYALESGTGRVLDPRAQLSWTGITELPWWLVITVGLVGTIAVYLIGYRFFVVEPRGSRRGETARGA